MTMNIQVPNLTPIGSSGVVEGVAKRIIDGLKNAALTGLNLIYIKTFSPAPKIINNFMRHLIDYEKQLRDTRQCV